MKKKRLAISLASLVLSGALLLSGCGLVGRSDTLSTDSAGASPAGRSDAVSTATSAAVVSTAAASGDTDSELFSERDLAQAADQSDATAITLTDGETLTITEAGVYILSGSAKEVQVVVKAADEDKVQLVLDGLSIINSGKPCVLVESADKLFLTSAEGSENTLTVSSKFSGDEDAVIYSRDDLVLNGLGIVTVSSSADGVRSGDDLKLTGGTWNVTAANTAIKAHDSILVYDGTYELSAGSDGLHAEDSDDDTTGSILIRGGSITIRAGDDGIHATTSVTVNGGTFTIAATEGLEATQVIINDGEIGITATDDGVNAGRKSKSLSVKIEVNGGKLMIVMGAGDTDGIDSNGDLIITGGVIDITGQSPFDYDGSCSYTGGTIIVNGTETNSVTNQMMGGGMGGPGHMGSPGGGFGGKRG